MGRLVVIRVRSRKAAKKHLNWFSLFLCAPASLRLCVNHPAGPVGTLSPDDTLLFRLNSDAKDSHPRAIACLQAAPWIELLRVGTLEATWSGQARQPTP